MFVGEEVLINALNVSPILQIIISPLIGLIPNCVSSIVLIELYLNTRQHFSDTSEFIDAVDCLFFRH